MESLMESGYSEVNGLNMYYEIHGKGNPLVLIHGGGSTIDSSFGNLMPELSKTRQLIAVEVQAHGRTPDRDILTSFVQDAEDVAALLRNLRISNADFLGFSNGGHTLIEIALRHPGIVNKMVLASTFYKKDAAPKEFWESFNGATIDMMPPLLKEAFFKVNDSEEAFQRMFEQDVQRMKTFKGWTKEEIEKIKAPTLIINGNHDVGSVEHAVEMYRTIAGSQLLILPAGHGDYFGAIEMLENGKWNHRYVVNFLDDFLG